MRYGNHSDYCFIKYELCPCNTCVNDNPLCCKLHGTCCKGTGCPDYTKEGSEDANTKAAADPAAH